jgi:bacteriocin biosynthesis cyclodehydratase domain-containing protein
MREGESGAEASVPLRPRLKPWYRVSVSESGAVLRYGSSVLEFGGGAATRLLPRLLPLLDGARTVGEIAAELGHPIRPAVEHALDVLAGRDLLTEPTPASLEPDRRRTAEFLAATDSACRHSAASVLDAVSEARACVLGLSPVADAISDLLTTSGVGTVERLGWADDVPDGALAVVAPSTDEMPLLPNWNLRAVAAETTWLQVLSFDGLLAAVGPIFVGGQTACYECYRLRRAANISPVRDDAVGEYPSAPVVDTALAGLAATVALRRLALGDGRSVGVLLAVEQAPELICTRHVVYRVPRCPACSQAAMEAAPTPWQGLTGRAA